MGGTSTDVCLVSNGTPALSAETEVDGLPIRTPMLDIVSVGAGGGSIVWVDDGGLLRVGPRSAGADPGPACYGRGGQDPTVTDAHLIRGTIQPEAFLGGRMKVFADASRTVFQALAERFGAGLREIADSAVRVTDASIVRAIQLVSTERGRDPRDYVLVPFGGAGPLHATRVAEDLGIQMICVPPKAGVLSAYGLLAADYVQYETWTRRLPVDAAAPDAVRPTFAEMESALSQAFERLALGGPLRYRHSLDMRFVGQAFEVPVTLAADHLPGLTATRPPRALPRGPSPGLRVRRERPRARRDRLVPRGRRHVLGDHPAARGEWGRRPRGAHGRHLRARRRDGVPLAHAPRLPPRHAAARAGPGGRRDGDDLHPARGGPGARPARQPRPPSPTPGAGPPSSPAPDQHTLPQGGGGAHLSVGGQFAPRTSRPFRRRDPKGRREAEDQPLWLRGGAASGRARLQGQRSALFGLIRYFSPVACLP